MKQRRIGIIFLFTLGGMLLLSSLLLALCSALMLHGHTTADFVSGSVIAAYLLSGLAGGFCMGSYTGKHKFLWGLLTGLAYCGIIYLAGRLALHKGLMPDVRAWSSFLICIVAGMLGGMLAPAGRASGL